MTPHSAQTPDSLCSRLLKGEITVDLTWLENDATGVSSAVFIKASAASVWETISDYNNLSKTLPKVVSSRVIKRHDNVVTIEQTGRTGILIFERTVSFVLQAREEKPASIEFHQIEGDFSTYEGHWIIEPLEQYDGCVLHYQATIKPAFFAPAILVSFVQRQDLPGVMGAHKHRAETLEQSRKQRT